MVLIGDLKLASFLLKFKRFLKVPFIFEVDEPFSSPAEKIKITKNYVYNRVDAIMIPNPYLEKEITEEFAPKAPVQPVPEGEEERARRIIEIAKIALRAEKRGW